MSGKRRDDVSTSGSILRASQCACALARMADRFFSIWAKRGALAAYIDMVIGSLSGGGFTGLILSHRGGKAMGKFVIAPHFRLQEWVAEEKGYFKAEGLQYEFSDSWGSGGGKADPGATHQTANKSGAY